MKNCRGIRRILLSELDERADRLELADPGMERARRHVHSRVLGYVDARSIDRAAEIVRRESGQNRRWGVPATRNRRSTEMAAALSTVETLDAPLPRRHAGAGLDAECATGGTHREAAGGASAYFRTRFRIVVDGEISM